MTLVPDKVDDANGNVFEALRYHDTESEAFVFFNKKSGFGNNVGEVKFLNRLKRLPNGNLGAGE
jgi:hypothetical protein